MSQVLPTINIRKIIQFFWIVIAVCAFWKLDYAFYFIFVSCAATLLYQIYFSERKKILFRTIDICIILIFLGEIANYKFSQYPPNTFLFFSKLCVALVLYTVFSLIFNSEEDSQLALNIAKYGSIIAALTFFSFLLFRHSIIAEGFSDFANLKHLYSPLGQIPNDWSITLLFLLSFSVYQYIIEMGAGEKKRWWVGIGIIVLLFSIFVTFSRGIYIASIVFFSVSFFLLVHLKLLTLKTALKKIVILSIVCVSIFSYRPIFQTIKFKQSTSQKRSTLGRFSVWENSSKIITDYPLIGIGSGNFPLYYAAYENKSINSSYTTRVNNTFIQILVEKGIIGLLSYGTLFLYLFYALIAQLKEYSDRKKKIFISIIIGLLCALIFKESTFSSLFENTGLLMLFFLLCVFIRRGSRIAFSIDLRPKFHLALAILVLLFTVWIPFQYYRVQEADEFNKMAVMAKNTGNSQKAIQLLDKAIEIQPKQAIYYIHRAVIRENENLKIDLPISDLIKSFIEYKFVYSQKINNLIIADYTKAMRLNPMDARAHQNIAWQYLYADSIRKTIYHLKKSIELDSSEELYWLSLGLVLDVSNDKIEANHYYVQALTRSPSIINSIFWRKFSKSYPERSALLINESKKQLHVLSNNDIVSKAKYATLLSNKDAVAMLEEVNRTLPNLGRAWLNLGNLYINAGKTEMGIKCLKRAMLLDKNDYIAVLNFASYLEENKKIEKAIAYYIKALQLQINARSTYDERVGRTYETIASLQTCMPQRLWSDVNFQLSIPDICFKLSSLYNIVNDEKKSAYYLNLSKKHT